MDRGVASWAQADVIGLFRGSSRLMITWPCWSCSSSKGTSKVVPPGLRELYRFGRFCYIILHPGHHAADGRFSPIARRAKRKAGRHLLQMMFDQDIVICPSTLARGKIKMSLLKFFLKKWSPIACIYFKGLRKTCRCGYNFPDSAVKDIYDASQSSNETRQRGTRTNRRGSHFVARLI